jgi:hypothetical protein
MARRAVPTYAESGVRTTALESALGSIARFFDSLQRRRRVSLVRTRDPEDPHPEDPYVAQTQRQAAADVERIEQDDKHFGHRPPASKDEL